MLYSQSSVLYIDNIIVENSYSINGGAFYISNPFPNSEILNSQFVNNSAQSTGGAIMINS